MPKWFLVPLLVIIASSQVTASATSLPVLVYHGIIDSELSPARFTSQMDALRDAGYTTITQSEANTFLDGTASLPSKSILITFDDGRDAQFYPADPILKSHGFNAVMFAITKYNTRNQVTYYLNKTEMQTMLDTGRWEVGAHAQDGHAYYQIDADGNLGPYLTSKLWLGSRIETTDEYTLRVNRELQEVQDAVAQNFSKIPSAFAYPFGQYGQNPTNYDGAKDVILDATKTRYATGFIQAHTTEGFTQNYPGVDTLLARRIEVGDDWDGSDLMNFINHGTPKSLSYYDTLSPDRGWYATYGRMNLTRGVLALQAEGSSGGASAFLDGTYPWTDYTFKANIKSRNNATVSLLTRFEDPNDYISCDFSSTGINIYQRIDDTFYKLASTKATIPLNNFNLTAKVQDSTATCSYQGTSVTAVLRDGRAGRGGIGLKVYGKPGEAYVKVEDVKVS
ncbi:MAG TPA: polysaccharide deacetylase family protein [Candidatus Binatia bacterium]|nr:polysaccharide deacetylase family protein [Candidatus Binatia bacterium]